jgi:hypothetical protein
MNLPIEAVLPEQTAPPPLVFVREVASLYHRNAWLFLKMLLPAALFGYCALILCTNRASEIYRQLPRGFAILEHKTQVLESTAFRLGGFLADWVFYCFAFAAMTVAVRKLVDGEDVETEECFKPVREKLLSFLPLSIVLWLLTFVASLLSIVIFGFLGARFGAILHWTARYAVLGGFAVMFPGLLLMSRFGLAIPALIVEKCSIKQSFFRSDELTEGCWIILAILLVESVGGSYLAYLFPQWLAGFAIARGFAPSWLSWAAIAVGLLLGVVLQPHMPVGFALLHTRRTARLKPGSE